MGKLGWYSRIKWILIGIIVPVISTYAADDASGGAASVFKLFDNLSQHETTLVKLIVATAYIIGFFFIVNAIISLKQVGGAAKGPGAKSMGSVFAKFIAGVALMYLPSTVNTALETLFGDGNGVLAYHPTSDEEMFNTLIDGVVVLVRLIGFISLIRGIIHLSKAGNGQAGEVGKGIINIVGGILGINIVATIRVLGTAFGIDALSNF